MSRCEGVFLRQRQQAAEHLAALTHVGRLRLGDARQLRIGNRERIAHRRREALELLRVGRQRAVAVVSV